MAVPMKDTHSASSSEDFEVSGGAHQGPTDLEILNATRAMQSRYAASPAEQLSPSFPGELDKG